MDLICRKFSLVAAFMLFCLICKSQYNFTAVDQLLTENQKTLGKELVALVFKDGKMIYQKETGDFTIKSKAPIASCSKWLTAALVMTFVDEGKFSLDDRVSKFLPIFETYGKNYITIRQCLSHQTGIADNPRLIAKLLERRKFESLEDEVNSFAKKEIAADPGTSFFYSGMGLNIAGRILELVSKTRFELLMKQRILSPLNMRNSSFTPENNAVNPSGGAISTAADYLNFLSMLLAKGTFGGKRILSEKAILEMQTVQTQKIRKLSSTKVDEGFEYGLGEWIEQADSKGKSRVVSCPEIFGTWPYIDLCKNYAAIIFVKSLRSEEKKLLYTTLQKAIDQQISGDCD
jgi:CubicO group peptidase (beta-lactamase class C family)